MSARWIQLNKSRRPASQTTLPDDFARRVILAARAEERRRRIRFRIGASICVAILAIVIVIAGRTSSLRNDPNSDESALQARAGSQSDPMGVTVAYQLAQATEPRGAGDYLLPDGRAMTEFASTYTDASWTYDPVWTAYYR